MPVTVSIDVPERVTELGVNPASPTYNPVQNYLKMTLTNTGSEPVMLPALPIARTVARSYRNLNTGAEQSFTRGGPPSMNVELEELLPGKSWTYGVGFEYPDTILGTQAGDIPVRVCLSWDAAKLDRNVYPEGTEGWAHSFEVCRDIVISRPEL